MIEIINFCAQHNIPIAWGELVDAIPEANLSIRNFPWNGEGLRLMYNSWGMYPRVCDESALWHDIGHWLIASPKDRKNPHFNATDADEHTAGIIGIYLHKYVGGDLNAKEKRYSGPIRPDPTGRVEKVLKEVLWSI